jgi:Crp-like helix-turn-helix domain
MANFGKESKPEPVIARISQEMLAQMIGTTRSRLSLFVNKFRKLGFIKYNGALEVHNSLLNVVLRDNPHINRRDARGGSADRRRIATAPAKAEMNYGPLQNAGQCWNSSRVMGATVVSATGARARKKRAWRSPAQRADATITVDTPGRMIRSNHCRLQGRPARRKNKHCDQASPWPSSTLVTVTLSVSSPCSSVTRVPPLSESLAADSLPARRISRRGGAARDVVGICLAHSPVR